MSERVVANIICNEPLRVPGEENSSFDITEIDGIRQSGCVFLDSHNLQCTALPGEETCIFSSLLRRSDSLGKREEVQGGLISAEGYVLDRENLTFYRGEMTERVTPTEAAILGALMSKAGHILSTPTLQAVRPNEVSRSNPDATRISIFNIRGKIENLGGDGKSVLVNVNGRGYRFGPPQTQRKI